MVQKIKRSLIPELVPGPLWGRSAARMLGQRAVWKKHIRADALAEADNKCAFCGSHENGFICHDKWQYNDAQGIATLIGFEIHCRKCDAVTHVGQAIMRNQSREDREEVLREVLIHLCKVNQCSHESGMQILSKAMDEWTKRSKKKWTVEVTPALVKRYPDLSALPDFFPGPRTTVGR